MKAQESREEFSKPRYKISKLDRETELKKKVHNFFVHFHPQTNREKLDELEALKHITKLCFMQSFCRTVCGKL